MKIKRTDGIHTKFRPQQNQFLDWLELNWNQSNVFGSELPTGVGKTALIKAIQSSFAPGEVDVISYSNQLVDDYSELYDITAVKGKLQYKTEDDYKAAKEKATNGTAIFNPYSWFYFNLQGRTESKVLVFDEAHKLENMLEDFSSIDFNISLAEKHQVSGKHPNDFEVQAIFTRAIRDAQDDDDKAKAHIYSVVKKDLLDHPEVYDLKVVSKKSRSGQKTYILRLFPIQTPYGMLKGLFGQQRKFVLVSATMPELLFKKLTGGGLYKGFAHPVDAQRRQVINYSVAQEDRNNYQVLGPLINSIIEREGSPNTLIHTTYGDMGALNKYLSRVPITHHKNNKTDSVAEFKKTGGTLVAAGMYEGVSFPDNECRLIIIPKIPYASLADPLIRKKMSCLDGPLWYSMHTMQTLWQMVGRGCRHQDDFCVTYVLDPMLGKLVNSVREYFDKSLINSIQWDHNRRAYEIKAGHDRQFY